MEDYNGTQTIEEILAENQYELADTHESGSDGWPDTVHHQSWHDGWRNSH